MIHCSWIQEARQQYSAEYNTSGGVQVAKYHGDDPIDEY